MSKDIDAVAKFVNRLFNYSYKFQSANAVATNADNGQLSTSSGYNENPLNGIGSITGSDRPQHGSSRIQLSSSGPSLPVDIGESPWISG